VNNLDLLLLNCNLDSGLLTPQFAQGYIYRRLYINGAGENWEY